MRRVLVNPKEVSDGVWLPAFDDVGRLIPYRADGTLVRLTTHISRALRAGDLVLVNETAKKEQG